MSKTPEQIRREVEGLTGKGPAQPPAQVATQSPKIENLKEGESFKEKPPEKEKSKGTWGGAREGAGGPPRGAALQRRIFKAAMEAHAGEEIEVTILDKKTGKTHVIKKTRFAIAVEKLFEIGTKGGGNDMAIDRWLNRMIGKPAQPIIGGDEDDAPVSISLGVGEMLKKIRNGGNNTGNNK